MSLEICFCCKLMKQDIFICEFQIGNLELLFFTQVVTIKTDESVTLVHMVSINEGEANLVACPEM